MCAASFGFQNESLCPHQVFDVKGQGLKQETAGVGELIGEHGPLCDDHLATQHHWLSSICTSDSSRTLINNTSIDSRSVY